MAFLWASHDNFIVAIGNPFNVRHRHLIQSAHAHHTHIAILYIGVLGQVACTYPSVLCYVMEMIIILSDLIITLVLQTSKQSLLLRHLACQLLLVEETFSLSFIQTSKVSLF